MGIFSRRAVLKPILRRSAPAQANNPVPDKKQASGFGNSRCIQTKELLWRAASSTGYDGAGVGRIGSVYKDTRQ